MRALVIGAVGILLAAQAPRAAAFGVAGAGATVAGTVRDAETSEPLVGAVVTLTDLDRAVATDGGGQYVLRQVPAGPQHVTVRLIGYAQATLHALVPQDGRLEINVSLRPEPVRMPPLDVRTPVVVRGVEGGDAETYPDRESSVAAVRNHPLLSEPEVFEGLGGGEVALRPESPSGVHIRGGASDQTAYMLDGIPVFSPFHTGGVSSAWNPDALNRLTLSSSAPSPGNPHALSGAIEGFTRAPGARLGSQGSFSTTQARLTLDGPLGESSAGYVVSMRSGLPDVVAPRNESSYLRGETADGLAKLEVRALGGRARILGYASENDVNAAAATSEEIESGQAPGRNVFEWSSQSLGAEWGRAFSKIAMRVLGWSAACDAGSEWAAPGADVEMTAARRDEGLLAEMEHRTPRAKTIAGVRFERSRTSYRIQSDSTAVPSFRFDARTPVTAAFAQHTRAITPRVEIELGGALAATAGDLYLAPRAELKWSASEELTLSGHYARTRQFAQSLRNPESVVGNVFPVDLYLGAGAPEIPVARSDQGVVAFDFRPRAGVRLSVQAYERDSDGLVLVAPRSGDPFMTTGFTVGSGTSRGVSAEAAVSRARYGIVASYGLQRVRIEYGDSSYIPEHGARHLLEGGVIAFPAATFSVRLGAAAAWGRRATAVANAFEWESCNLLDQGCEFGGSPHHGGEPLGGTPLPAYFRVDLGVRKHWHFEVGGRDATLGLFGTVTNLLGRRNVLTYAKSPVTGERVEIEMRPQAPLVAGLDWRF